MDSREINKLNQAMNETHDKRLYERYLAVRLHLEEYSFSVKHSFVKRFIPNRSSISIAVETSDDVRIALTSSVIHLPFWSILFVLFYPGIV